MSCDCHRNYGHEKEEYKKLCVKCLKAESLHANDATLNNLCAQSVSTKSLAAEDETLNSLCVSGRVTTNSVWSNSANTNSLCATNANFTNACITNLKAVNYSPCNVYRATVNFSGDTTYTLGALLNFNNIVDDPNGNVSLAPTTYHAPAAGYYELTYKVNVSNLQTTNGPVLGIPVANPTIEVNGLVVREAFSPFLAFFPEQKVVVSSLLTLKAGDQVTMRYDVLGGNGVKVAGTVDILGSGLEDGNSLFKIIYLSSLCQTGDTASCMPCAPVDVPCQANTTPCTPLDVDCDRCEDDMDDCPTEPPAASRRLRTR